MALCPKNGESHFGLAAANWQEAAEINRRAWLNAQAEVGGAYHLPGPALATSLSSCSFRWCSPTCWEEKAMSAPPWRQPTQHELKCWPPYFDAVVQGIKTFEVRNNDREFMAGDTLWLREWNPHTQAYSGKECFADVMYLLGGGIVGIQPGYVVMSIRTVLNVYR